jgi:hypothetical protein
MTRLLMTLCALLLWATPGHDTIFLQDDFENHLYPN